DLTNFRREKLFDPGINISLGTTYLAQLLKSFNGNLHLALASYNAGPTKIRRWLQRSGQTDMEAFVENMPYKETRNYVKSVLRNLFIYREIYGSQT
ncbi:MAG: lytic transglycosylase domain-containing protein, partial [Thermodesulfobacteriota bacterium]